MPIDEIRVGDVDGDDQNEIVMVGPAGMSDPKACLSVWKYLEGGYTEVWSYRVSSEPWRAIQSMDLGDVDGDGVDEIVTSAEITGRTSNQTVTFTSEGKKLSVWNPGRGGSVFFRSWQGGGTGSIKGMQAVRVCWVDESGRERVIALGRTDHNLYMIRRRGGGYKTERFALAGRPSCLDVWPVMVSPTKPQD